MNLTTPLSKVQGFGPTYLSRLARLGISSVGELIYHFPFRYDDLSSVKKIAELSPGEVATVRGEVWEIGNVRTRRGKTLTRLIVNDGSGSIEAVFFNQPYLARVIRSGTTISLAGKVSQYSGKINFSNPDYELGTGGLHTGRLVAVYPETEGLSSKWIRGKIARILPETGGLKEYLPERVMTEFKLLPLTEALQKIHLPQNPLEAEAARRRFGFEEFFLLQLASLIRKAAWQKSPGVVVALDQEKLLQFTAALPFQLTSDQNKVLSEILGDLGRPRPMNRLLQGDVGSGKTVVAAAAAYMANLSGFQTALMAPTEILANQHYQTLRAILEPHGLTIGLRTGSRKLGSGTVTVGTHALLSRSLEFKNLGLVVIDEQHRFGVEQRALLRAKGTTPHVLTMTATPIPRTLALTLYGDLDISVISSLPPGRQPIKTYLVPPEKRNKSYQFVREKIASGQQIFVVTPLIEPSETLTTVRSAKAEFDRLKDEIFPELKLGLLHGRLKSQEKEGVLQGFRDKKYDILVTTPVVEVGIDVPNAAVMMIEGAERFGLAQLHQLRGRVGRGAASSWCLLFTEDKTEKARLRLQALEKSNRGQELAELDLNLRGPGEIYGLRQSGIPALKIADLADLSLLEETKKAAERFVKESPKLPAELKLKLNPMLAPSVTPD